MWQLTGYNFTRAKKKTQETPKSLQNFWSQQGTQKLFTLTIL